MLRKVLYSPQFVLGFARALREARADLRSLHSAHLSQLADLKREIDGMRAELDQLRELRAVTRARIKAESDLRALYREREIARAKAAERTTWLN